MSEPRVNEQARLAALYEVSSQLGASLDLTQVLNQVMDAIIQLTGAERGYLVLFDEDSGDLQPAAARNVDQETIAGKSMKISRTVIERAVATGEGILTSNAQEDERFAGQQSVVGYQLRSIMCAPLRARSSTVGAVYVDNRLFTSVFDNADLELLVTFANQAAIAIDNARLFTRTDQNLARRVEELSLFQRIDQQLNKSLDLNRVLNLALHWAISLTGADSGSIGLLEINKESEEQGLRLLVHSQGEEAGAAALIPFDHPVLHEVWENGRSSFLQNINPGQAIDNTPAAAQLAVPIKHDGVMTGLITLESQFSNAIDNEDIAFVERLADRAAVAIKNARLYEEIQAISQAKSEFISVVTHELRLPMTAIKGYNDLIIGGMTGPLTDQQKQFLQVIRRNIDRMQDLISDLSDINRIESGRMKFENRAFAILDTIHEVRDSLQEVIAAKNQSLKIDYSPGIGAVYADPKRIGQVLTNLVSNAYKYTPPEGVITIQASEDDDFARVTVSDNGIGISEENQVRLFTQFFRAEDQAVREQNGWGLGLSIVKKIVEAQGGEIDFVSELNRGSTFTFTIPLANIKEETAVSA
ncbi:MAG: GAF domain-containing protein [Ardenticatenaceae bacterium]|nr:GAF domain-containing protein [Ardenticatenaceae bacterium]MCB9446096.1 GAF domain-containing protein [Ardenticatenaceae bacterium]